MKKSCMVLIILLTGLCTLAQMGRPAPVEAGAVGAIVCYIPNRVFDLMDIFRFRVRVGPGISAGVRATRPLSAFVGFHSSVFGGLPGPRGKKRIPWPVGFDLRAGAQASIVDASSGTPHYDFLEVGFETQLFLLGLNVGIGGIEILDFFTGFVFIDLMDDDFGVGNEESEEVEEVEEVEEAEEVEEEVEEVEEVEEAEAEEEAEEVKNEEPAE
jgi:hypothetical protein